MKMTIVDVDEHKDKWINKAWEMLTKCQKTSLQTKVI